MLRRVRLSYVFGILVPVLLDPRPAPAQQPAPDVVFTTVTGGGAYGPYRSETPLDGGWNDSGSFPSAGAPNATTSYAFSGSASGNSATFTVRGAVSGNVAYSWERAFFSSGRQDASVYVKGSKTARVTYSGTMRAASSGSGPGLRSAAASGPQASGPGSVGTRSGVADASLSWSTTRSSCGQGGMTFPQYPGTTYYKVDSRSFGATVDAQPASSGADVSGEVNLTAAVQIGAEPVRAEMSGPLVGGVKTPKPTVGQDVEFRNVSVDPDEATVTGSTASLSGVCSARWEVTGPDGVTKTSTNLGGYSFRIDRPGGYTVTLAVTDNEGDRHVTTTSFRVGPRRRQGPGDCPGEHRTNCADSWTEAKVCPGTGNATFTFHDPVPTRGDDLAFDLSLHTQSLAVTPPAGEFGNALHTYAVSFGPSLVAGEDDVPVERWLLRDGDGEEYDFGPTASAPVAPSHFFGLVTRDPATGVVTVTDAGGLGSLDSAGNYSYTLTPAGSPSGAVLLTSYTDPSGNPRQIVRGPTGGLEEVLDVRTGKKILFLYEGGLVTKIVENQNGAWTTLAYEGGKVVRATVWQPPNEPLRSARVEYDAEGRVAYLERDGDALKSLAVSYVNVGSPGVYAADVASPDGQGSRFSYRARAGVAHSVSRRNAKGGVTEYDYDVAGNLVRLAKPAYVGAGTAYPRAPTLRFTYDARRLLTAVTGGRGGDLAMSYDVRGNLTRVADQAGGVKTYTFRGADLLTASDGGATVMTLGYTDPRLPHSPTTVTDAPGAVWTVAYNAFGQPVQVTPPAGSPSGPVRYTYDEDPGSPSFGLLLSETDGGGGVTTYSDHTALGDPRAVSVLVRAGVTRTTNYVYDALRKETARISGDGSALRRKFGGGDLLWVDEEDGVRVTFESCPSCGKVTGISRPPGHVLRWTLDADADETAFTDANGHVTGFDLGLGKETRSVIFGDGAASTYVYDERERLVSSTNARGMTERYMYDPAGRLVRRAVADVGDAGYDASGRMVRDGGGVNFAYDAAGRLTREWSTWRGDGTPPQSVDYTYFPDGALSSLRWSSNGVMITRLEYGYDLAGRVTSVTAEDGTVTRYTYDMTGALLSQSNPNGTETRHTYDDVTGRRTSTVHRVTATGAVLGQYVMTYDQGGRGPGLLTKVEEPDQVVTTYEYDGLRRLVGETRTRNRPYTKRYGYDLQGNLLTSDGLAVATYDSGDKLATVVGGSVSHDADGNLTSVTGGQSGRLSGAVLAYDGMNRLTSVTKDGVTERYGYEGLAGHRTYTDSADGSRRRLIHSGDVVIGELLRSGTAGSFEPTVAYRHGPDGPTTLRQLRDNRHYFYHFGPQGETRLLSDIDGGVRVNYSYSAYGRRLDEVPDFYNPLSYGGQWGYRTETGLIQAGHRWYSFDLTRWTTKDPIWFRGGANLYSYVANNPASFVDPDGLKCWYSQSTGRMYCINIPEKKPYYDEKGYSGHGEGINNPAFNDRTSEGPIPTGPWRTYGDLFYKEGMGRAVRKLAALPGNSCFSTKRDCNTFRIHGDNKKLNQSASKGCIILPPNRVRIPPDEIIEVNP